MANAIIASGAASIEVDSSETEARLIFIPASDGEGWDAAAIHKLASEKNITIHPDPKDMETFLAKASKAKAADPMEMVYCQGLPPEQPQGEKTTWEDLPVPDDIAPFQKEVLEGAEAPEIFRIKTEKIKHEKKVAKQGALPFMQGKEEVAVTWEKKESREAVNIDPEVKMVKYAQKGAKLGTISPSVPGKPGKSISGRPIPPAMSDDGSGLFGKGITREKNTISAAVSGFLRIGENWADLVPFSKHSYTITTGTDGISLFMDFFPGDSRFAVPEGSEIIAAEVSKGAAEENFVSAGELNDAIENAIKTGESLSAFSLFHVQESLASVEINSEKTVAVLHLRKGLAGASPLKMESIFQALKDSGVHGFDAEKLKADVQAFLGGKELELKEYPLVKGISSTRGKDRGIEILAAMIQDNEIKPVLARLNGWKERESLKTPDFDFMKAREAAFVTKGDVLAKIGAGSKGEDGKDIYGSVIPGLPGNDPDIDLIRGLEIHGQEIKAVQNGLLLLKEKSEKSFHAMVVDYKDARVAIHISDDAMEARGDFFREEGAGIQLTLENVKKVLAALGVKEGTDWEELENACHLARTSGSVMGYVVARGRAPLIGGDSEIKWLVRLKAPVLEGAEATIQIKAGTPVLELSEPIASGRPGCDVKGNEIPIENGSPQHIEHDNSIRAAPHGKGKRLVAVRSGELKFDGKKLEINSVHTVEGNAKGSLKFPGEIRITGNVLHGCAVIGGSNVTVEGMAQEALVSAGGKAHIALGVKGGGIGILRAKAGIEAAFIERASVMAVGDIVLKKGSIMSTIKTNGKLRITAEGGKLAGGSCQARNGVDTTDIGSPKGTRTEISFGQDYLVKEQIGECEEVIKESKKLLSGIDAKIAGQAKKNSSLSEELKDEKMRLAKVLDQYNLRLFALKEKFEEHHESEIRCRGTVFPGLVIESHNRYYEVKQERNSVVFYFDRASGTIKERSIE